MARTKKVPKAKRNIGSRNRRGALELDLRRGIRSLIATFAVYRGRLSTLVLAMLSDLRRAHNTLCEMRRRENSFPALVFRIEGHSYSYRCFFPPVVCLKDAPVFRGSVKMQVQWVPWQVHVDYILCLNNHRPVYRPRSLNLNLVLGDGDLVILCPPVDTGTNLVFGLGCVGSVRGFVLHRVLELIAFKIRRDHLEGDIAASNNHKYPENHLQSAHRLHRA